MNQLEKKQMIDAYKASLRDKSYEELKALEAEVIAEAEQVDNEIKDSTYDLPADNYKEVCEAIRMLLNNVKVQWQFTLGLVAMYDFWNPEKREKTIPHPMLDGTLRTLGEMQFTGYNEWAAVVAINKYFEPLREAYVNNTERVYDVAMKHNEIMDALALVAPGEDLPKSITVE